jgi:hypothetical protein
MSNVSAHSARPRRIPDDAESLLLRHWSDVLPPPVHEPPPRRAHERPPPPITPEIANVIRDLVSWAADLAITLTNNCPDDRLAIEQVRAYVVARLDGARVPELELRDVLTSAAVLMSGIDLRLRRATSHPDDTERCAVGVALLR